MYEIGKLYRWRNQVGVAARINGVECIPDERPSYYRHKLTNIRYWGQHVVNSDGEEWIAFSGDLVPVNPPSGEKSISDLFKAPSHEPA